MRRHTRCGDGCRDVASNQQHGGERSSRNISEVSLHSPREAWTHHVTTAPRCLTIWRLFPFARRVVCRSRQHLGN